jgi:hypothetical protein
MLNLIFIHKYMPQEGKDIVIENFQEGNAQSMHFGFSKFVNVDIVDTPGIAKVQYKSNVVAELPNSGYETVINWFVRSKCNRQHIYGLTSSGILLFSANSGQNWTSLGGASWPNTGNGMIMWNDHLIIIGSNTCDAYNVNTGVWTYGFTAGSIGANVWPNWHSAIVSRDNILYYVDGHFVHKIKETNVTPFDPANPSTFQATRGFLSLKDPCIRLKTIQELRNYIAVGTEEFGYVYFWNYTNGQRREEINNTGLYITDTYWENRIDLPENNINAMLVVGNSLYVQAGNLGKIYTCNSVQAAVYKEMKFINFQEMYEVGARVIPGGMAYHNSELLINISMLSRNIDAINGVYGIKNNNGQESAQDPIYLRNTPEKLPPPTYTDEYSRQGMAGAILSIGESSYIHSYSVQGQGRGYIDGVGFTASQLGARYDNYDAIIESKMIPVGNNLKLATMQAIMFSLVKILKPGQGLRMFFRRHITEPWDIVADREVTQNGNLDYATLHPGKKDNELGILSYNLPIALTDAEYVQVRIEMKAGQGTGTTPELRRVLIRNSNK